MHARARPRPDRLASLARGALTRLARGALTGAAAGAIALAGCGADDATTAGLQATGACATPATPLTVPAGEVTSERFSFFVTSLRAMQRLSGCEAGFGGDLRYGQTGAGAGLRGADQICAVIAESSLTGAGHKAWRAFLSASVGTDGQRVDAIDRVGDGPWYDRLGRVVATSKADLLHARPANADAAIVDDLPNEDGVPNHQPDPTQDEVDNHHILTGTNTSGALEGADATCLDWTTAEADADVGGRPRVGLSWPRGGGGGNGSHWMSAMDEAGCGAGIDLIESGGPDPSSPTVGSGGGYGAIYCFALTP